MCVYPYNYYYGSQCYYLILHCEYYKFSRNTRKYGPEKTPYLDTFQTVLLS